MRIEMLLTEEFETKVLRMEESNSFDKGLKQLYFEAEEYDFLKGKTPQVLPEIWEEEE